MPSEHRSGSLRVEVTLLTPSIAVLLVFLVADSEAVLSKVNVWVMSSLLVVWW